MKINPTVSLIALPIAAAIGCGGSSPATHPPPAQPAPPAADHDSSEATEVEAEQTLEHADAGALPDRITHADNEEDCRRCNGTWGPRGILSVPGCVCPTLDGGKPCRRPADCEHRCELPWSDAVKAGKLSCRPDGTCDGGQEPLEGRCSPSFEIFGCRAWIIEEQTDDGPRLSVRHICVD